MGLLPRPPPRRLRRAGAAVTPTTCWRRHRAVLPDWLALYYEEPIEITHGEGRHVWDADGNRYLDFFGGILTTMTAHALPEVTTAVSEQAGRIIHTSTLYLNRPMVELAERIAAAVRHPRRQGLLHHLRHRGQRRRAAAGDVAAGAVQPDPGDAQQLPRPVVLHDRASPATAGWSPTRLSPLQTLYVHGGVPLPRPVRATWATPSSSTPASRTWRTCSTRHRGDVAALIAEPIQGVGGFTSPPDGLFGALPRGARPSTASCGSADEVQTGWGRTGEHFWGWQAHGRADRRTSSPSPRASATACPSAGSSPAPRS